MDALFGLSKTDILNPSKIKVFDGIAGSAKSSNIDRFFKEHGIDYGRYTSTNKLKRDAARRYGGHNDTIAGGLFTTENGEFFCDQKEVPYKTIVIDEVLQSDARVLKAALNLVGSKNIIMCTDTRQMLAPVFGEAFLKKFKTFCERENVIYTRLTRTYRARTMRTAAYYNKCYNAVDDRSCLYREDHERFATIKFDDMPFTHDDVYICHTNDLEAMLYEKFHVKDDYSAELIPKGMIARKKVADVSKYPILPQKEVEGRQLSYFQPENIGTPTRYQGSEVETGRKLYFLVEENSFVSNREWYTVVSRLYDIRDLVIVLCSVHKVEPLTEYNGKPVKKVKCMTVSDDVDLGDGETLASLCENADGPIELPPEVFGRIVGSFDDTDDTHFDINKFYFNGVKVTAKRDDVLKPSPKDVSMMSLLNKEPDFDFSFMPDFMRCYERCQRDYFGSVLNDMLTAVPINGNSGERGRLDYKYGLDLKAAFPTILNFEFLPTGGRFVSRQDGAEPSSELFNWWIGIDETASVGIFTDETKQRSEETGAGLFYYMGGTSKKLGSRMGTRLYEMSNKSIEANEKRKGVHYGLLARSYLFGIDFKDNDPTAYAVSEYAIHQLLMIAIRTKLDSIMYDIKKEVYRDPFSMATSGLLNADCLYFDYDGDICELGDRIASKIPNYSFRIFKNGKEDKAGDVLYKNYEELRSEKELKKIRDRERMRAKRAQL